jgi:hypothetical protein
MRTGLLLLLSGWAWAQLNGIVNSYAAVTAFVDPATVTVDDPFPFNVGDRVLLYQAKGATIDVTNSASYGDITSIGSAGVFEFHQIAAINGNNITFTCPRVRTFGNPATDAIQLVKVAYSNSNLTITGTVTALPWDGSKGGIVVIETDGTLSFNANINVRGQGFRGGLYSINGGSSNACEAGTYFGAADDQAGRKGEGVANWPGFNHYAYRGKLASGGGGGNNHNTGGGGGSNYGAGGQGGWTSCGSRWWCPNFNVANSGWGYGGVALSSYLNAPAMRAFMGGGGGGGHQNNDEGGQGGNGGGIVLIRAATIVGNDFQIIAAGDSGRRDPAICGGRTYAGNDGAGGGGGGGSVILLCNTYAGTLTIDVQGGRGGNCSQQFCSCRIDHGPGGGGGGGYVAFSTAAVPAGITTLTSGGANGIELTPEGENANGCDNTTRSNCIPAGPDRFNRGATPGANGDIIFNVAYDGLYPCPAARIALEALSLEVSPLHALFVQYAVAGLPAEARLRFTLETPTLPLIQEETAPQGRVRFPLERPGRYLLRLEALTDQGSHRLAERPFTYQPTYALTGRTLTLWHDEGGPYQLSDLSGRTLTQGYLPPKTPLTLSLESLPAGLYYLSIAYEPPIKLSLYP